MSQYQAAIDMTGWVGQYPFRGIHNSSLVHLAAKLETLQVEQVIASPFEALFWENNLDTWRQWATRLADTPKLELWPVVNPAMPGQLAALETMLDTYRPRGLRLLPNYHGYHLADSAVDHLMRLADERGLVIQLFQRIADERWHWMLHTSAVPDEDILAFVERYAGQKILISGMNQPQVLGEAMRTQPMLYADISRLRGPLFAVEQLLEQAPIDRLVFGSLWPIQIIEATLWQVWHANIGDDAKASLLRHNAARLLKRTTEREAQLPLVSAQPSNK